MQLKFLRMQSNLLNDELTDVYFLTFKMYESLQKGRFDFERKGEMKFDQYLLGRDSARAGMIHEELFVFP